MISKFLKESDLNSETDSIVVEEGSDEELDEEITLWEVKKTLGQMKNNKAPGEDGVPVEFLKKLPNVWLEEFARIIYDSFDKGDEEIVQNYRGGSLLDIGSSY